MRFFSATGGVTENALAGPWLRLVTSLTDGFVTENAWAGAIPTDIGKLVQLKTLDLTSNGLTGTCPTRLWLLVDEYTAIQKKTSVLRRYYPEAAWALHGYGGPQAVRKPIDR